MTNSEYAVSEQFMEQCIYRKIEDDWITGKLSDERSDSRQSLASYLEHMDKYIPSEASREKWTKLYEETVARKQAEEAERAGKEAHRVGKMVQKFIDFKNKPKESPKGSPKEKKQFGKKSFNQKRHLADDE